MWPLLFCVIFLSGASFLPCPGAFHFRFALSARPLLWRFFCPSPPPPPFPPLASDLSFSSTWLNSFLYKLPYSNQLPLGWDPHLDWDFFSMWSSPWLHQGEGFVHVQLHSQHPAPVRHVIVPPKPFITWT